MTGNQWIADFRFSQRSRFFVLTKRNAASGHFITFNVVSYTVQNLLYFTYFCKLLRKNPLEALIKSLMRMGSMPPRYSRTRFRTFAELFKHCTSEETSAPRGSFPPLILINLNDLRFCRVYFVPPQQSPCTGSPKMPWMTSQYLANQIKQFPSISLKQNIDDNRRRSNNSLCDSIVD